VSGWSDPRMPTLKGLRRRGYTPASIRDFCSRVGITRKDNLVEIGVLENCIREDLDPIAPRVMAVLRPLKLVIDNYPDDRTEELEAPNHPKDPSLGSRPLPFSKTLYIERDDFMESPPKKFFRLSPGNEVRLRYAYLITCVSVVHGPDGEVTEVHCVYDPESRGGNAPDGRKVKGTIHWVCAGRATDAEIRLYDRLFSVNDPLNVPEGKAFTDLLNPHSMEVLQGCKLEPGIADAGASGPLQFERLGYFCLDSEDSAPGAPVFNRTVTLRDTWARASKSGG
jgi:glutaminyl-tRNA synthetase